MDHIPLLLDFLALFIPASVAVVGSYLLYKRKQRDQKRSLRESFLAELQGNDYLEKWPDTSYTVPIYNFLSLAVYENNASHLGLLTEQEVIALAQYYSRAKAVQDVVGQYSDMIHEERKITTVGTNTKEWRDSLRHAVDKLELARQRAILSIESELSDLPEPEKELPISDINSSVERSKDVFYDFGFAEEKYGEVVLTEKGADFLLGDLLLTGLRKERDVLGREKHPYRRKIERIWDALFSEG